MAQNGADDILMPDAAPNPSEDEQSSGPGSSSDGEDEEEIVPMVVARQRRANAGARMSHLLKLAGDEDTQNLEAYGEIFEEAADDNEFQADEDVDGDVNMESSSEEEDDEGREDDMQGEKELKATEKKGVSHKRKRAVMLDSAMKRATARQIPRAVAKPPPESLAGGVVAPSERPRKKSERVSWLPEEEEGPKRQSSRQLSVQNKEMVHSRLKEKEKHRLRTVAIMKAAEMRKDARKPKILTQAERLEEAAKTERMNSKSLNRWETAEKKRVEEQAARLAALKNRKLEGPIISYWSGPSLWVDGKLKGTGKAVLVKASEDTPISKDVEHDQSTSPATPMEVSAEQKDLVHPASITQTPTATTTTDTPSPAASLPISTAQSEPDQKPMINLPPAVQVIAQPTAHQLPIPAHPPPQTNGHAPQTSPPVQGPPNFMDELQFYANLPLEVQRATLPPPQTQSQAQTSSTLTPPKPSEPAVSTAPPKPQTRELAARTLIELREFGPDLKVRDKDMYMHYLCDWPASAPKKLVPAKKTLCVITGQAARYCDPVTGFAYADSCALKNIRRVMSGGSRWSVLLGAYTGPRYKDVVDKGVVFARAAVGVPEGFYKKMPPLPLPPLPQPAAAAAAAAVEPQPPPQPATSKEVPKAVPKEVRKEVEAKVEVVGE
ncbi:YL1-domain-containing protein [Tothia fuscella]|uniref:YL1-domain-containing protein n=1 Tax=Tothia fuscella TaxID=1048955 RepID=A0A9P4U309_9PEZI|nr:YL1-domain-containing protein [Tothia fuscella]